MEEIKVTPIVTPEKQLRVVEIKEGSFVVERKFPNGWKYLDSDGCPAGDASVYNIFKIKKTYSSLEEAIKAMESFLVFPRVVLESSDTSKLKTPFSWGSEEVRQAYKNIDYSVKSTNALIEYLNILYEKLGLSWRADLKFVKENSNENLDNPI